MVVRFVMGGIEQCHRALLHQIFKSSNLVLVACELRFVTACKLAIALWIVPEPLAQSRARRDFLQPADEPGVLFTHTARPQPVHKNARPIGNLRRVVDAFDPNRRVLFLHLIRPTNDEQERERVRQRRSRCTSALSAMSSIPESPLFPNAAP